MSKQNDAKWSKAVRKRDKNYCRICLPGCTHQAAESHHIFSRRYKNLRWDIDNGLSVCWNCHNWLEQNPHKAREICKVSAGNAVWKLLELKMEGEYGYVR